MKLYKHSDFVKLPDEVLYCDFKFIEEISNLEIKTSEPLFENVDFDYDLLSINTEISMWNHMDLDEVEERMKNGESFELDIVGSRKGIGNDDSNLYLVFEKEDIKKLIERLIELL